MTREELIAYDKWLTRRKWGTGEIISPKKAADLYLAEHPLPPAEGAVNFNDIYELLGRGIDKIMRGESSLGALADEAETFINSEVKKRLAQQQPTAGGADVALPTDKDIAIEIAARFLHNPHPNQKANYEREKKAFANGAIYMREAALMFATLHAQRLAEKTVEDELRKFVPPEEDFPDFDESKKNDPSYCVEWGMLKQRNIERQIWNKAINNLKSKEQ